MTNRLNLYGEDLDLDIEVKSDSVCIVKLRRKQKVMHHKLKLCESKKLPKWFVDFQGAKVRGTSNLSQSGKINCNDQCVGDSLKPKVKRETDQASVLDGPYRGTGSNIKASPRLEPSHKRATSEGKTKNRHSCLFK